MALIWLSSGATGCLMLLLRWAYQLSNPLRRGWHQSPACRRLQQRRQRQPCRAVAVPAFPVPEDSDEYLAGYDSDDYSEPGQSPFTKRISQRTASTQENAGRGGRSRLLFATSAERQQQQGQKTQSTQPEWPQDYPWLDAVVLLYRRWQLWLLSIWQTLRTVPRETVRAVQVTWQGARDVITQTIDDGVTSMRTAAEEARMAATRSRAAAEHDDGRPCPNDFFGRIQWLWDRPSMKRMRITLSMAQWSVKLPALVALIATQVGLLASQVSLPMLAPLLLGTGMLFRSIKANASLLFPRIGLVVVLLYVLWFANSVVQNTVVYLRRQGAIDHRICGAVITASELSAMLGAAVIVLSMLGVNLSGLLLPAGVALAFAAKDLSHNFLAGFFLFAVQPFRLGDRIAVHSQAAAGVSAGPSPPGSPWFEGICEKVDLRYTIIKNGDRRLYMPNSNFITSSFMVLDSPKEGGKRSSGVQTNTPQPRPQQLPLDVPGAGFRYGRYPPEDFERQYMLHRPRPGSRAPSFQHQRSTSSHPRRSKPEGQEGRPLNGAVNSSFDGARPSGSRSDTPPQGQAGKDEPWSHSLDRQHMAAAGPDRHSRGVPGYVRYAEPGHRYGPPEAYWFNEMNPYWEDELWQSEYQPSDYRPRQGDYWHESGGGQDDTAQDAEEQQFYTSKH
eukprot:jgi/Astpho2/2497/fgenesh1_pg.00048_%23_21_t